jgi:hypothetical protein
MCRTSKDTQGFTSVKNDADEKPFSEFCERDEGIVLPESVGGKFLRTETDCG